MLASLLALTLVLAQPSSLVIRSGDLSTPLPVLQTQRGPMVRLEDALTALGAALVRNTPDTYKLFAGGAELELTTGVSVVKLKSRTEPLPAPPSLFEGRLLVPLALLTDVLPRAAVGYAYNSASGELRHTRTLVKSLPPPERPARRAEPVTPRRTPLERIVVVDAGHGGPDRGMTGSLGGGGRVFEKDITLGVARQVRDALVARGIRVVMTRERDTLIALADRGRIANQSGARVFISVHVNAANPRWKNPSEARGFETYFLSEAKTEDERRVEAMENEAVKYEGEEEVSDNDPLKFILNDMKQNEFLRESSDLAAAMQRGLRGIPHPGPSRGVKQAGFVVLNKAFMPAVLVEVGFGSNPAEARWMASTDGQRSLGQNIAQAVADYLDVLDRKAGGGNR